LCSLPSGNTTAPIETAVPVTPPLDETRRLPSTTLVPDAKRPSPTVSADAEIIAEDVAAGRYRQPAAEDGRPDCRAAID
jgi:hypothetical protein